MSADAGRHLCVNCTHHEHAAATTWAKGLSDHRCRHPDAADVVTGAPACCYATRSSTGACGVAAVLFVELLERAATKADPRRFTGEPITGFGEFGASTRSTS
jgi:hypothetical protein